MKAIPERFKNNGLFIIMFLITVLMIITVSVTITWTTIRMSEQFFIDKFSITNGKVMNEIKESFETFNYSVVSASNSLLQSGSIRKMLTEHESNLQKMSSFYNMSQLIERIEPNLDAYQVGVRIIGVNGVSYSTDGNRWPISDQELKDHVIAHNTLAEPKRLMYQFDLRSDRAKGTKDEPFIVASRALMDRITGIVYGSMYFAIEESEFRKFYSSYTSLGNNVYVINKSGIIVSSNQSELIGQRAAELLGYAKEAEQGDSAREYSTRNFMGKEQIMMIESLPTFDMYLVNVAFWVDVNQHACSSLQ